jgi:hypothetical protein
MGCEHGWYGPAEKSVGKARGLHPSMGIDCPFCACEYQDEIIKELKAALNRISHLTSPVPNEREIYQRWRMVETVALTALRAKEGE